MVYLHFSLLIAGKDIPLYSESEYRKIPNIALKAVKNYSPYPINRGL